MSCGNHHDMPCSTVQSLVYLFLDNEPLPCGSFELVQHFEECPPCAEAFLIEQILKERLASLHQHMHVASLIEQQICEQITSIRIEITEVREERP